MIGALQFGIPAAEYHNHQALSKSQLAVFAQCPALYKYHFIDGHPIKETDDMRLGSAAHMLALEPARFAGSYYVLPDTQDGKKLVRNTSHKFPGCYNDHLKLAGEKSIITQIQAAKTHAIARALLTDPATRMLLQTDCQRPGYAEHRFESSIFWTDEETGLDLRCRPDDIRSDDIILDLKVTDSADPDDFGRNAANFKYDLSVAQTSAGFEALHGRKPADYILIAIERDEPNLVSCFRTFDAAPESQSVLDIGNHRWRNLLRRFKVCLDANHWPAYVSEIGPLKFPAWSVRKIEENKEGL